MRRPAWWDVSIVTMQRVNIVRSRATQLLTVTWAALLVIWTIVVSLRIVERRLEPAPSAEVSIPDAGFVAFDAITGAALDVFPPGASSGVVFVSPTCNYCLTRAEQIENVLADLNVDKKMVVVLSDSASAAEYAALLRGDVVTVARFDPSTSRFIDYVPTFVVRARDGSVKAAVVGIPSPGQRRSLDRELREEL